MSKTGWGDSGWAATNALAYTSSFIYYFKMIIEQACDVTGNQTNKLECLSPTDNLNIYREGQELLPQKGLTRLCPLWEKHSSLFVQSLKEDLYY